MYTRVPHYFADVQSISFPPSIWKKLNVQKQHLAFACVSASANPSEYSSSPGSTQPYAVFPKSTRKIQRYNPSLQAQTHRHTYPSYLTAGVILHCRNSLSTCACPQCLPLTPHDIYKHGIKTHSYTHQATSAYHLCPSVFLSISSLLSPVLPLPPCAFLPCFPSLSLLLG